MDDESDLIRRIRIWSRGIFYDYGDGESEVVLFFSSIF